VVEVNETHLKRFKKSEEKLIEIYEGILRNVHARNEFNEQFSMKNAI
jgi:ribosomal protein S21